MRYQRPCVSCKHVCVFLVQIIVKLAGDYFEVELPDGKEIQFPNREGLDIINYVRVKGDFKVTSFKMY